MKEKIIPLETVFAKSREFKKQGKKIVLCHGLFDFLHIGHIRYLKQARTYGEIVMVSIVSDKHAREEEQMKFNEIFRAEAVASLEWVDFVIINPIQDILGFIKKLNPDVFLKGFESVKNGSKGANEVRNEEESLEKMGVRLIIAQENDFASTGQINRYIESMPKDIQNYIHLFKKRYNIEHLLETIEDMKTLKVLVLGDTILDEYYYCSAIGKSSKDPTLALKYQSHDRFVGGVVAVTNHIASFAQDVDLVTILGEKDSYQDFIRSHLKENVNPHFKFKAKAPTLIKRRFLDSYSMNKLLEVYVMDDSALDSDMDQEFCEYIRSRLNEYDIIVAADFGHGTINASLKNLLSYEAPYLAVNAQSNAGNRGFNNITKYPRVDYVSMAEHEIRLEMRDLEGKIWPMIDALAGKMGCLKFAVTRGRRGCMFHNRKEGGFIQVPSFATNVVDRVGAGDAFFAITSLASVRNAPSELIAFLGNVAGSLAVEIMGNQKSIDKNTVKDYIYRLLS
ncbi:PfkB family carbohydrate kinase [Thermodesulfobacteriota bacterium]